ncbi:MAG TPA: hypothetical protein DD433_02740, partial [Ruminococcaceae bacterium]|nr:hypothetical protein [Oscillospiraceae bacterium]
AEGLRRRFIEVAVGDWLHQDNAGTLPPGKRKQFFLNFWIIETIVIIDGAHYGVERPAVQSL